MSNSEALCGGCMLQLTSVLEPDSSSWCWSALIILKTPLFISLVLLNNCAQSASLLNCSETSPVCFRGAGRWQPEARKHEWTENNTMWWWGVLQRSGSWRGRGHAGKGWGCGRPGWRGTFPDAHVPLVGWPPVESVREQCSILQKWLQSLLPASFRKNDDSKWRNDSGEKGFALPVGAF